MDVAGIIRTIATSLPPLLLELTLHELAHGYVALRFGDQTARWAGRLTLNPIKHMDPLGTFFIIFGMITRAPVIGWAKPVPVNPHNLHRPHTDMIWVALAGPAMNLALATASAFALRWFPDPRWYADSSLALSIAVPVFEIRTLGGWKRPIEITDRLTGLVGKAMTSQRSPRDIVFKTLLKQHLCVEGRRLAQDYALKWRARVLEPTKSVYLSQVF